MSSHGAEKAHGAEDEEEKPSEPLNDGHFLVFLHKHPDLLREIKSKELEDENDEDDELEEEEEEGEEHHHEEDLIGDEWRTGAGDAEAALLELYRKFQLKEHATHALVKFFKEGVLHDIQKSGLKVALTDDELHHLDHELEPLITAEGGEEKLKKIIEDAHHVAEVKKKISEIEKAAKSFGNIKEMERVGKLVRAAKDAPTKTGRFFHWPKDGGLPGIFSLRSKEESQAVDELHNETDVSIDDVKRWLEYVDQDYEKHNQYHTKEPLEFTKMRALDDAGSLEHLRHELQEKRAHLVTVADEKKHVMHHVQHQIDHEIKHLKKGDHLLEAQKAHHSLLDIDKQYGKTILTDAHRSGAELRTAVVEDVAALVGNIVRALDFHQNKPLEALAKKLYTIFDQAGGNAFVKEQVIKGLNAMIALETDYLKTLLLKEAVEKMKHYNGPKKEEKKSGGGGHH